MAFTTNRQQTLALGMAVLLLAAVVAPVCVMFAQPAMAMPMPMPTPSEQSAPTPQDCDEGGSAVACPHATSSGSPATTPRPDVQSDVALPAAGGEPADAVDLGPVEAPACSGHLPPPAHLTPLRL